MCSQLYSEQRTRQSQSRATAPHDGPPLDSPADPLAIVPRLDEPVCKASRRLRVLALAHRQASQVAPRPPRFVCTRAVQLTDRDRLLTGLRDLIELNTTFLGSRWSEASQSHTITLEKAGGKPFEVEADFLISAAGPLSTPEVPRIPGLDEFKGVSFHCYRWEGKTKFEGKRVAVIGNGSSGVQMVVSARTRRGAERERERR